MVFVWSKLTGDGAYTLVQVASNDLIILTVAFVPIVSFLLKMGNITFRGKHCFCPPLVLFIAIIPLILSVFTRKYVIATKGQEYSLK